MKIVHLLASPGPGGAESLVRDLAIEHVSSGHEVEVFFFSSAKDVGNSPDYEAVLLDTMNDAGVTSTILGHRTRTNALVGSSKLGKLLRMRGPDVLHIHLQYGLLLRLALSGRRMATVYTHHTDHLKFGVRTFGLLTSRVEHCIAISSTIEGLLRAHTRAPVTMIRNAVAARSPKRRRDGGLKLTVLSVGRLYPDKGYRTLIEAASMLGAKRPDLAKQIQFMIAGEGPQRAELEEAIQAAGLQGQVILLGLRQDVPDLIASAQLYLMTSRWEGLPISLIEAAQGGLPIIATNVGGCSEVVRHGVNGYLVPPENPDAIAEYLIELADKPETRKRMGKNSLLIAEEFSIVRAATEHLRVYEESLFSRRNSGYRE